MQFKRIAVVMLTCTYVLFLAAKSQAATPCERKYSKESLMISGTLLRAELFDGPLGEDFDSVVRSFFWLSPWRLALEAPICIDGDEALYTQLLLPRDTLNRMEDELFELGVFPKKIQLRVNLNLAQPVAGHRIMTAMWAHECKDRYDHFCKRVDLPVLDGVMLPDMANIKALLLTGEDPSVFLEATAVGANEDEPDRILTDSELGPDKPSHFVWPIPKPSTSAELSLFNDTEMALLKPNYKQAERRIKDALSRADYSDRRYYILPPDKGTGFVIVTRLEQTDLDAKPREDPHRWSKNIVEESLFSLKSFLRALLTADKGYFRVLVFVVSDTPLKFDVDAPSMNMASEWLSSGEDRLYSGMENIRYSDSTQFSVMVYEFEHNENSEFALTQNNPRHSAIKHLSSTKLNKLVR
ncbi:MAG: hypothetical protein ACI93R_001411 [Flavobacteriales bacterium]|jgi:hypothetical protein